jgi:hypothetical protein
MNVAELRAECKSRGIPGFSKMRKDDLLVALAAHEVQTPQESAPEPAEAKAIIKVKGRSVGATTMVATMADKAKARNKAKARRRSIRAAGGQAGF